MNDHSPKPYKGTVDARDFRQDARRKHGLLSRITGLVLTVNMIMAYVFGDHDALFSFISDPDKFVAAAPFAFLVVSLIVLIFGAGKISLDTAIALFFGSPRGKQANSFSACSPPSSPRPFSSSLNPTNS